MAQRANKASVEAAVNGPDYEAALAIINGRVASAKGAQSKASGEASQAWGDIEKLGVNKRGAQLFAKIQSIEDEDEQQDQLRTFAQLCKLEGIEIQQDLMDMAEGKKTDVVPVKEKAEPAAETAGAPADEPAAKTEDLAKKPRARGGHLKVVSAADAKAKAQEHLGTSPAPDAI